MPDANGFVWVDVPGYSLSAEDKEILAHPAVSGVILFAKNFESVAQLQALTRAMLSINPNLVITADQEGGRVQRFVAGFTRLPAMSHWGAMVQKSPEQAATEFQKTLTQMIDELRNVHVYAPISPVLDIDYGRNAVIGERSFGDDPALITLLGKQFIDCLHRLKVPVIGKHFPGHGWVSGDSHETVPIDERSFDEIKSTDLRPFATLVSELDAIMPAHIVYSAVDQKPASFSRFWLQQVLREQLGFEGLIITDDLTMQGAASSGDYVTRAELALDAGADILTVCNSRAGVIDILDRVRKPKDPLFLERWRRYCRYL